MDVVSSTQSEGNLESGTSVPVPEKMPSPRGSVAIVSVLAFLAACASASRSSSAWGDGDGASVAAVSTKRWQLLPGKAGKVPPLPVFKKLFKPPDENGIASTKTLVRRRRKKIKRRRRKRPAHHQQQQQQQQESEQRLFSNASLSSHNDYNLVRDGRCKEGLKASNMPLQYSMFIKKNLNTLFYYFGVLGKMIMKW